ncbi:MAG: six-hairpin glycosidase [Prevotella sp.]|jgi:hypothetical protein|nr:six-hairpin glycosidase [Prevotella sp.]
MKQKAILLTCAAICIWVSALSQQIEYGINPKSGAINRLSVKNDMRSMNWIIETDGSQYPWVTEKYGWGLGYFTQVQHNEQKVVEWKEPVSVADAGKQVTYKAGDIQIDVKRIFSENDLIETYTFTNKSKGDVSLSDIGIYTPFSDNYPSAKECLARRTNVHIWEGENSAYVNAMHMSGQSPHLGLVVTEGSIKSYEIWERGRNKQNSQTRGIIALNMPDIILKPNEKTTISWKIFSHKGWEDFQYKVVENGNIFIKSKYYLFEKGETASIELLGNDKLLKKSCVKSNGVSLPVKKIDNKWMVEAPMNATGEVKLEIYYGRGKKTHADFFVHSNFNKLTDTRVNFIIDKQQYNNPSYLRNGAYMVYDNETDKIYLNNTPSANPPDRDEGAERVGMGLLQTKQYQLTKDEEILQSLFKYAGFIRKGLQDKNYRTWSSVDKKGRNRAYNYVWIADFYFRMYQITKDKQYATDGYMTLQSLYSQFGHGFYAIGTPVVVGLNTLKEAGMDEEYAKLYNDFIAVGATYIKNSLNYPSHEVNYEQSIVAPSIMFLTELYLMTKDRKYLDEVEKQLPALEAFGGFQPSYHLNEVAIRHWDGYWFGKREMFGDTFPHYWSTLTALAYHNYYLCTGNQAYQQRAENIVRNNLCLFFEDGKASCAYMYPYKVNNQKAAFYDPYANDQDFALFHYLRVNEGIQ